MKMSFDLLEDIKSNDHMDPLLIGVVAVERCVRHPDLSLEGVAVNGEFQCGQSSLDLIVRSRIGEILTVELNAKIFSEPEAHDGILGLRINECDDWRYVSICSNGNRFEYPSHVFHRSG